MAWLLVFIGGLLDIGWALGMKYTEGFTKLVPSIWTIICLIASFLLFTRAMSTLPIGAAYAVFTGVGAAGTAVWGMVFEGDPVSALRIVFILVLLAGILGLKLLSPDDEGEKKTSLPLEQEVR